MIQRAWQRIWPIMRILYGAFYGLVLLFHLVFSTWLCLYTFAYNSPSGESLIETWSMWFAAGIVVGAMMLPGAIWALMNSRQKKRPARVYGIGFTLYIVIWVLTLATGIFLDVML